MSWISALVTGCILVGIWTVMLTEALSAASSIARAPVIVAWAIAAVLALALAIWTPPVAAGTTDKRKVSPVELFCLGAVVVLGTMSAILALVAAPTTGDAMSYHMPRVVQWIQNRSLSFYPTHIDRQLWLNPGAEYVILQLQLLHGSDRFANMVQWAAALGGAAIVFNISGRLGATREWRSFGALFCISLPMGVAQSTGGQTDLIAGFWLLAFVAAMFMAREFDHAGRWYVGPAIMGGGLGLAILTKGTNYIFAAPFLAFLVFRYVRPPSRKSLASLAVVALVATVLNAGHYYRNASLYGSVLGPSGLESVVNAVFTPQAAASNLIRNLALHAGTPEDSRIPGSLRANEELNRAVAKAHRWLGIDVDDPRTTWKAYEFRVPFANRSEITSGNPVHLLVAFVAVMFALVRGSLKPPARRAYFACVLAGAVLFCILLRWQPFNSRLHLPLFMLAAPLVAVSIPRTFPRAAALVIGLFFAQRSIHALLNHPARPLMGSSSILSASREARYFVEQPEAYGPYLNAARFLKETGCRRIGLQTGWAEWEYGFWIVSRNTLGPVTMQGTGVSNPSAKLSEDPPAAALRPCAVVSLYQDGGSQNAWVEPGFRVAWRQDSVTVQLPLVQE